MKDKKKIVINIVTFKWFFIGLTYFYKKCVSPLLPRACIYYPTCSDYMLDALKEYGVIKGIIFGVRRLLRCVPWQEGGFDPLPYNPRGEMKWLY